MPPKSKAKAKAKVGANKKLTRPGSKIHALDASGAVFKAFYVWSVDAPIVKKSPDQLYGKCLVLNGSNEDTFKLKQVEPEEDDDSFESSASRCYNANSNIDPMAFPDIGMLPHTNDACVLDYMRARLVMGNIFVTAEPLLVVQNPFKNVGNATDDWIRKYRDVPDVGTLGPHVFSIARTALENLHSVNKSQTIIVSGESGAGKTEATKQAMRFFAAAKSGAMDLRVQKAILAANPVLEAFGNAKTIRNNNSSRFGRYMQLLVAANGGIQNGSVQGFLLEKSRILCQEDNERSYHIFYQILKGVNEDQKKKFKCKTLQQYKYINPKCLDSPGINDLDEWKDVCESFDSMMMSAEERDSVLSICSGVLLMGNVNVVAVAKQGLDDAAEIEEASRATFEDACALMFIDPKAVEEGITVKISIAGGNEIRSVWKKDEGDMLKASLVKGMYDATFQYIIRKLNSNIEPEGGWPAYMGMLDIFGFEVFKNNSLEQLFINVTNEMLQKNFTDTVFERESKLYKDEGIPITDLIFTSNAEVIEALSGRRGSLFATLEDQCLAPGGSDEKFLSAVYSTLKGSTKVYAAKVGGNQNFIVAHTIGEIQYLVEGFLFKNKDVLRAELVEVVQASTNVVSKELFAGVVVEKGKSAKGQLIGSQFMNQLSRLMELINATEAHFIRCVKPNEEKLPLTFTPSKVLIQLQSLSILEALQLRNLGYSYRRPFSDFLYQYKFVNLGITEDKSLEPMDAAKKLLISSKIPESDWKIGKTMTFMKPAAMKAMQHKQREALASWQPLISLIEALYKRMALKKEYLKLRSGVVRAQALTRRRLAGKIPSPPPDVAVGF
uniref:Myosin A n=1 Tax=Gregarina polymorpha TaxID=198477 RepID=Q6TY05_GREPO|nr:myosin A [Gregarina polymorpha]